MKRIKFIFVLIFFALPIFFLTSCEGGIAAEAINRVSTTQDKKVITEDFVVNAKILYEGESFLVEWNSNNEVAKVGTEFVDNTGKSDPNGAYYLVDIDYANNTETDQIVTLTATIKKGSSKGTKDITFTVPKAVGVSKEELDLSKYNLTSIPDAIEIANAAGENKTTERYYIYGTVKSISSADYGAMYITDGTNDLYIYGMYNSDGTIRYNQLGFKPAIGDEVIIYANLCTYNGEPEVHSAWLIEFKAAPQIEMTLPTAGTEISIAKAIDIANYVGENATTDRWIIKATVKTVSNPQYGEMTITDGTDEIYVYGTYDKDGVKRYSELEDKPVAGDSITLSVNLSTFKGTPQVKAGWIQEFTHNTPDINPEDYEEVTIAQARDAEDAELLKVSGVVAQITYANGKIPNGVYLVDNTGSIYVYGIDIAGQVKVGNTITIVGEKDYYVLGTETEFAQKYGYKGANQISSAYLIENDGKTSECDLSWVTESTVKEILNTPLEDDITTNIYKVNAVVNKVEGNGFVNYYFNDLDNATGSYTYTQCSGGDFTWLDEFDGKICTVYLSAINCKSSASGCIYRFLPISVEDENYQFDGDDVAEFVYEYHVKDQFLSSYQADPAIELVTSVSSELLGFENATITYTTTSANANIETADGVSVLHITDNGIAEIKIVVIYGNNSCENTIKITFTAPAVYDTITVAEAASKPVDEVVITEGIVGGSLVNQSGFYLIDETGVISVRGDATIVSALSVGDHVVVKGTRYQHNAVEGQYLGQTCINNFELLVNYYGGHTYSKASFITGKTIEEIYNINYQEQHANEVYIVQGTIDFIETTYYSQCKIKSLESDTTLTLYCSSAKQYNWLKEFSGKEITMEIVLCNWNKKSFYATCMLSVTYEGQTYYNTLNFSE